MELYDQFVLSRGSRPHPSGWAERSSGPWVLATSPTLPVTPLRSGDGGLAGWLLGWVVAPGGELLHERAELALEAVEDPGGDVEERLYRFSGRWACVLLGDRPRVHLDPAGSLAAVYSEQEQALASTTTALSFGDAAREDRYAQRVLGPGQYHPAGITSDPKARRLLPNHRLDLGTWEAVRHWPPGPVQRVDAADAAGLQECQEVIAAGLREHVEALAARHRLVLPLTAGRDSRMLMAAARRVLDRCTFAVFAYEDERRADVAYAREVARRFGLRLQVLPLREVDEAAARSYLERVGYDANEGKAGDFDLAARALPLDHAWLTGFAGEVGRGAYWKASVIPPEPTAEELLQLIRLPHEPAHIEALAAWRAAAPHQDVLELLDLAYLELRVGCWASPQLYGAAPFALSTMPVAQRSVFTAMLRLPPALRVQQRPHPPAIRLNWPELADLPYERAPGPRGWPDALRTGVASTRERLALGTRAARLLRR
ncbi:hypothetical protein GTQ99_00990 [Kineococcus sp. T13]|uniref:hypothetical protein n=1 Tax=Kineococcus vitellinus TaxID=2696565 RepID=UPI001412B63C|nr:hypothetical protein [Kineococcus vitellinus]NAZ74007.1 hypothetical protein [Kineococcus vitellinus]